jgi:hypothetical protein
MLPEAMESGGQHEKYDADNDCCEPGQMDELRSSRQFVECVGKAGNELKAEERLRAGQDDTAFGQDLIDAILEGRKFRFHDFGFEVFVWRGLSAGEGISIPCRKAEEGSDGCGRHARFRGGDFSDHDAELDRTNGAAFAFSIPTDLKLGV